MMVPSPARHRGRRCDQRRCRLHETTFRRVDDGPHGNRKGDRCPDVAGRRPAVGRGECHSEHRRRRTPNEVERVMRALVYHGPGLKAWEEVPKPEIIDDTDAIVRVDATTICGTDLHILKGDVPAVTDGRILGHEAVGTVEAVGAGVKTVKRRRPGPRLVHHRLRDLPVLPRGPLRPVPRRRRLDPRPQDRRHPGRVRPGAVRRHLDLPGPRRRRRRGAS